MPHLAVTMAIRIKSRWHVSSRNQSRPKYLDDHASALAFIAWRLSLEGARELHGEGYDYLGDHERIAVITEFAAFLLQCVDRQAYGRLQDRSREYLINALAHRLAEQMQDNLTDIAGPGNYRAPFITTLNEILAEYGRTAFADDGPEFDNLRVFGANVLNIMGETQTNRWVIDQIMQVDGPDVYEKIRDAYNNLGIADD